MVDLNELKALLDRATVLDDELAGVAAAGVDVSGLQTKVAALDDDVRTVLEAMTEDEVAAAGVDGQGELDGWLAEYGTDGPDEDDEPAGEPVGTDFDVDDDEPDDTDLPAAEEPAAAADPPSAEEKTAAELHELVARRLALQLETE